MCLYQYRYYSACQHGELTRITSCDKVTALGLPNLDGHSPHDGGVNNTRGAQPGLLSSNPPASSADHSSTSHSQSHSQGQHQHQPYNNMSAIVPTEAWQPHARDAAIQEDEHRQHQSPLVPRSAMDDDGRLAPLNDDASPDPPSKMQTFCNLNIDVPLDTQSSLHMELTHDGKVTELVARFESYAGYSDASEESHEQLSCNSSISDHLMSDSDTGTVRGPPDEQRNLQNIDQTAARGDQQLSPRKPLPTHWLPKNTGPSLATAQRAKERSHKKSSQSGSPVANKTLRGSRSSIDMAKISMTESSSFLTKEALAAVGNNLTSPTSPLSPNKLHRSPSKPSWQSPNGSSQRSSPRQNPAFSIRMSPTKSRHLKADFASATHSRGSSSVATSTGENSYHTAEGSPVRSPADSEHSFKSAAELPEELDIPLLNLSANDDDDQVTGSSTHPRSSPVKPGHEDDKTLTKPKLTINIPLSETGSGHNQTPSSTVASAKSSSTIGNGPWSSTSSERVSRIPRVATTSKTEKTDLGSTLKRAQSVKSLTTKARTQRDVVTEPCQIPLPGTPAATSQRHVHTVDSSGTTPVVAHANSWDTSASVSESDNTNIEHTDASHAQNVTAHRDDKASELETNAATEHENLAQTEFKQTSAPPTSANIPRSLGLANTKSAAVEDDPSLMDPAIIYSRKKSDAYGTMLERPFHVPPIIVMMAHDLDLGTLKQKDTHDDAGSATTSSTQEVVASGPDIRGRRDGISSDLRATAPSFVPGAATTKPVIQVVAESAAPELSTDLPGLPQDMSVLDRHGIPFLYYMYPVQCAYEQGFRNGRSRSLKKFKPKKNRSSVSSPVDAPQPPTKTAPTADTTTTLTQRRSSAELMPPPSIPTRRQANIQRENRLPNTGDVPFSTQLENIARHTPLHPRTNNSTNNNFPPNTDLTTIQNVHPPFGPRALHHPATYHTMSQRSNRRHPGNGLYGGRGNAAGVPMSATAPFPDPVAPLGRMGLGMGTGQFGNVSGTAADFPNFTIGKESCGVVDVVSAAERVGGEKCNACAPDH